MFLHIERIGSARSGPVLVFLHHGLGSIAQWRDFPASLCASTGLPGLLYDRLGHGRSASAPPRHPRYLADEALALDALLRAEQLTDFVLVGHSDGGSIALLYAALPGVEEPHAIVSIAAHTFVEDITRAGIRAAVDDHLLLRAKLRRLHGEKVDTLFWDWAGTWLAPSFDTFDIRSELHHVSCPLLALQGDVDEYGTIAQLEALAAHCRGPVATVLIPGAAHEPHLQSPAATLAAICAWLERVRVAPPCAGKQAHNPDRA